MSENLKIPIKMLNDNIKIPKHFYSDDAGFDLQSTINTIIEPGKRQIIPCGFSIAIPNSYAGLILPRSGLSIKYGITVINSPGLVDSGYRGEICVALHNTDVENNFKINIGDRIAQLLIIKYPNVLFDDVDNLDETKRLSKGFGSSGQ